jgi:hypothetical protein
MGRPSRPKSEFKRRFDNTSHYVSIIMCMRIPPSLWYDYPLVHTLAIAIAPASCDDQGHGCTSSQFGHFVTILTEQICSGSMSMRGNHRLSELPDSRFIPDCWSVRGFPNVECTVPRGEPPFELHDWPQYCVTVSYGALLDICLVSSTTFLFGVNTMPRMGLIVADFYV